MNRLELLKTELKDKYIIEKHGEFDRIFTKHGDKIITFISSSTFYLNDEIKQALSHKEQKSLLELLITSGFIPDGDYDRRAVDFYCETDFSNNVKRWAKDRGLDTADSTRQVLKLVEELGELTGAMARNKVDVIKDSIGDIDVVLEILCLQLGINRKECQSLAWNEIKDRKGKMINGVFVKEEDLK